MAAAGVEHVIESAPEPVVPGDGTVSTDGVVESSDGTDGAEGGLVGTDAPGEATTAAADA